jgi:hypothetical protein
LNSESYEGIDPKDIKLHSVNERINMSRYKIPELETEYREILRRLHTTKEIYTVENVIEKGTLLVSVYVRPTKGIQAVDFVGFVSEEVHAEQTDADRQVCAEAISRAIKGLHWKVGKGYCRKTTTDYYLRPDWKFWYSNK